MPGYVKSLKLRNIFVGLYSDWWRAFYGLSLTYSQDVALSAHDSLCCKFIFLDYEKVLWR